MGTAALESLMTPREVAEYLRKSVYWVTEQAREGKLPMKMIGRRYVIRRDELIAWYDSLTKTSSSPQ